MMRKAKYSVLVLLLTIALLTGGCQLAREDLETPSADRFAGLNVKLISAYGESRIEPHEIDGYALTIPLTQEENGSYVVGGDIGECFGETHLAIKDTEAEGREYSISAKMYLCVEQIPQNAYLAMESVYQRPDGTLYAVDTGGNYSGNIAGLTHERTEKSKQTDENGETRSESMHVRLELVKAVPATTVLLIEMNEKNEEITRKTLGEENIVPLSSDAAWALVEEHLEDGTVRRTAVNQPFDEAVVSVCLPGENGICRPVDYSFRAAQEPDKTAARQQ